MLASIIMLLIQICIVALVIYLIIWVLEQIGIALPAQVIKILWVICVLIVLYILAVQLLPMVGGARFLN